MSQRPTSIFGLTAHALRLRWDGMGRMGKALTVASAIAIGAMGVSMFSCAACSDSCPSAQRAQADESPCPYSQ